MKVRVEELSPVERKLSIEVEPAVVSQELDRAYATLSRQVKIAGFRPGKVPRRILEQKFRRDVEDDVIHRVVERAFLEAIREHKVEAVGSPQVRNEGIRPNEPFTFEARVEVKPKVEPKDYKGLSLKKNEVKVTDDEVDKQLAAMQKRMVHVEPLEGRTVAQAGDVATIDFEADIDGKPFPGNKGQDVTVEVTPGELVHGNLPALEGTRVGAVKEIPYVFPADYREKSLQGKQATFRVTLKTLKQQVTPELNDDFAKEMGLTDFAALKAKVKDDLTRSATNRVQAEERDALVKALIAKNPFDVPKAMVERALDVMLEGGLRAMMRAGVDPRMVGMDFQKLREDMRERADSEVRGTLLFEAIATQEKISATDAEIDARIEQLATESGQALSAVKKHYKNPDERRGLSLRLTEEKTVAFLKSQATYS